jgi:hypothetical protein
MLVFGDDVLKPDHLRSGCREFKNVLAYLIKITPEHKMCIYIENSLFPRFL